MEVSTSELLMYLGKLYLEKELVLIQVAELNVYVGKLQEELARMSGGSDESS